MSSTIFCYLPVPHKIRYVGKISSNWIGFGIEADVAYSTDNGRFKITDAEDAAALELKGIGKEKRNGNFPLVTTC